MNDRTAPIGIVIFLWGLGLPILGYLHPQKSIYPLQFPILVGMGVVFMVLGVIGIFGVKESETK